MKNKKFLFWTSVVILLPCVVGLLMWNQLPEKMPTHWGVDGQIDGWSGKGFAIFGIPLLLLVFQWISIFATRLDKQNQSGSNAKVLGIVMCIFPVMSILTSFGMYRAAMGLEFGVDVFIPGLIGLMFLVIGNYLPKCRQNSTLGIKLPWTFASEENWNKTHRLGGKVWTVCGLGMIVNVFVGQVWLMLACIFSAILVPTVYSWLLYRKQMAAGTVGPVSKELKRGMGLTAVLLAATAVFLFFVLFSGSVDMAVEGEKLVITTAQWDDMTLDIAAIDSIEYRAEGVDGSREWGYGSLRLLLGLFRNEEFGNYTRYTYADTDDCIVLRVGQKWLIINADGAEATQALYRQILDAME